MDDSWMQCPLEAESAPENAPAPKRKRAVDSDWMRPPLEDAPSAASSSEDWMKPPLEASSTASSSKMAGHAHGSPALARITVNLSLPLLKLLPADFSTDTAYSRNGKSVERIAQALKAPCRGCRQQCSKQLTARQIASLAAAWYKLSSISQQQVLFGLFHPEHNLPADEDGLTGAAAAKRRCWQLDGQTVCFDKFCALLGHTPRTVLRMVHGEEDMRKMLPKRPRLHPQQDLVMHFFLELYMSTAEQLPEKDLETSDGPCEMASSKNSLTTPAKFSNAWILDTPGPERIRALSICNHIACVICFGVCVSQF